MPPTIPTCEPLQFAAGDTVIWQRSSTDYPATDGWTLKYAFRGVGRIDIAAVTATNGQDYLATIPSTATLVPPGLYEWTAWVENGATPIERHTIGSGRVNVLPQLSNVTDTSRQQHAERMIPLIEAQLEQLAASPIETYTIEQQTTVRRKMAELEASRAKYKAELRRLKNRGRLAGYSVVFGRR